MKTVLFHNINQFPSLSMRRYGAELSSKLHEIASAGCLIEDVYCNQAELVAALVPGRRGQQWAERVGRLIKYPLLAAMQRADVFHILDHSHAHLDYVLPGHRTIVTCHDVIPLLAKTGKIDMPAEGMAKHTFNLRLNCLHRAARVIAVSESTKRNLIQEAGIAEDRIVMIYNGLNSGFCPSLNPEQLKAERSTLRAQHNLPPEAQVVLQVATKNKYKNTPLLLQALSVINKTRSAEQQPVWLLRLGADFFPEEQALICALGLEKLIVRIDHVKSDEELTRIYRAADVLAFPSLWEGFGWPPLEAMACGLPVVASNVASLPEVIGDGGILINPTDSSELASMIERLLNDEALRNNFILKGLKQAEQFSWERAAVKTLEVYQDVWQRASSKKS